MSIPGDPHERDVRTAESRFITLFEQAPIGVSIEDMGGRYLRTNPELQKMLGYSEAELDGLSRFELTPVEGLALYLPQIAEMMGGMRERVDVVLQQRCKAGNSIWTRLCAAPLTLEAEETGEAQIICMAMDVTPLVEARDSLARRQQAIAEAQDGIAICDERACFTFTNRAFADLFGGGPAIALVGRSWYDLYGDLADDVRLMVVRGVAKGGTWQGELEPVLDGQKRVHELSVTGMPDGGLVIVARDVTERRRVEEERARLREQILQTQKLDAVGRMASGVAHDFNNLIAAINNYSEMVLEDLPPDHPSRNYVERIRLAGRKGQGLVRQILGLSRQQPGERTPVAIADLMSDAVATAEASLGDGVRFEQQGPEAGAVVLGSALQLEQVVVNLLVNAVHASEKTRADGAATIRVDLRAGFFDEAALAQLGAPFGLDAADRHILQPSPGRTELWLGKLAPATSYVAVTVADSGSGMPRDVVERMFDPFFSTKAVGKGSGIGLASVLGIILAHEGGLHVATEPGVGTSIDVFLPLEGGGAGGSSAQPAAADVVPEVAAGPRECILVVDDDPDVGKATCTILSKLSYGAEHLASPEEALEALAATPGRWELVITDEAMPGLSGIEFARALKARGVTIPVILCSGHALAINTAEAYEAGIAAMIDKPLVPRKLARVVRRALDEATRSA
ncbi:PAS domain-containing hybrid sensor histidine kinase/response regulator [Radicibacter daui]|uniref:PAS domain-containing hybrid sensor histidine kinase/response regulator n=1 Tax=Radicibacter daui TaxID=3064829 RepID=UPI004046DD0A